MDTKAVRERLVRRREELLNRAGRVSADLRRESDPLSADFSEQVVQRENDDVLAAIGSSAQTEVRQIEAALARLEAGRYGICSRCGGPIQEQRLAAVPYADRCRTCAGEPGEARQWNG